MPEKTRKEDLCPMCGKHEFSRVPSAGDYEVGGRQEKCSVCRTLVWIPVDASKPVEAVVVSVGDVISFEPEEIIFGEIKLLERGNNETDELIPM